MRPHNAEARPPGTGRRSPGPDPLILVTNDDGIGSPGLEAAIRAALPLGELLVAAPDRQWSGAGRGFSRWAEGRIEPYVLAVDGHPVTAYQVGGSPAVVVQHAVWELAPRRPALLISGINYGENIGNDVTGSGTVGAALQAAVSGIASLAVSLQTPKEMHHVEPSDRVNFGAAVHFARKFGRHLLNTRLPFDVDILKVDVPSDATPQTPWRVTRVSRHAHYVTVPPTRAQPGKGASVGLDYTQLTHPEQTEPDSDIYALRIDRVVSVAPLSIDLTARVDFREMDRLLGHPGQRDRP
jgi:5'-nucleotidase